MKYLKILKGKYYEFLSVSFHEKPISKIFAKRRVLEVITLQYLPFLVLAMSPKIFLKSILNMPQICGIAEKSKTF